MKSKLYHIIADLLISVLLVILFGVGLLVTSPFMLAWYIKHKRKPHVIVSD